MNVHQLQSVSDQTGATVVPLFPEVLNDGSCHPFLHL